MSRKKKSGRKLEDPSESSFNKIFDSYKQRAKKSGRPFKLTRSQFKRLTKQPCYYCGALPTRAFKRDSGRAPYTYNGIDRLNSSGVYSVANTVSACWNCNAMKGTATFQQFIAHIGSIASHLLSKIPNPTRRRNKKEQIDEQGKQEQSS